MDYNELLKKASQSVEQNIQLSQQFRLKDLFNGAEWERIPASERRLFGKYFANEVRDGRVENVVFSAKRKDGQSIYEKV